MGQTLSHGVYLPNEGERNCYAGLASNWQILNTAVGNIAEKAPLVHTHGNITNDGKVGTAANKPLITGTGGAVQAGSFGNQANTFCEGNDSRLSDARTPVAHTHGKTDITDLLNSDFIPSANDSYNLGSSSYQWNNAYVKSLTINGVACGDILTHNASEFVNVTTAQTIAGNKTFTSLLSKSNTLTRGTLPTTNINEDPIFVSVDKNNRRTLAFFNYYNTSANGRVVLYAYNQNTTDYDNIGLVFGFDNINNRKSIHPVITNTYDLGTSSLKWKTLNGINPGALSLPDYNNYLDVTSSIPVASLDGTQIDLNTYLADKTGWLSIVIADTAGNYITVTQGRSGGSTVFNNSRTFHTGAQSNGYISVFFPIIASMSKFAFIKASSLIQMRFYYCLGNV